MADTKRRSAFGVLVGGIVALFSGWRLLFVIGASDPLWQALAIVGLLLVALGVIVPAALAGPERLWMLLGETIGRLVLSVILLVVYLAIVLPSGLVVRMTSTARGFLVWSSTTRTGVVTGAPGWVPKTIDDNRDRGDESRFLAFRTVSFFIRRRAWFIIPALIVLVLLGILFFFVQDEVAHA